MTKKLLYVISPYNDGLVFAEPKRAKLVHRINSAIKSSKTWEEFRKAMPRAEYSKIIRSYDEDGQTRPRGADPFDAEELPGWSDGDYPPWLQREMDSILPLSFFQRFGESVTTSINGDYWMIPKCNLAPACAALEQLGYQVEVAAELEFH